MTTRDEDDGYNPWSAIDARIDTYKLMAPLTEAERYVIFLHHIAGYSMSELAEAGDVNRSTIWRMLKRAEDKMRIACNTTAAS